MVGNTVSSAGIASVLVAASTQMWGADAPVYADLPLLEITQNGAFLSADWDGAAAAPSCNFYNFSARFTGALCSHFAVARMSSSVQKEATSRALACASAYSTDCVLSTDVGLSIPAAWIYDPADGLQMLIAPKIVPLPEGAASVRRLVSVQAPQDAKEHTQIALNSTLRVEFLEAGSRRLAVQTLNESAAFCVQLLRLAIDESCWSAID